jgi:hypothetical protein
MEQYSNTVRGNSKCKIKEVVAHSSSWNEYQYISVDIYWISGLVLISRDMLLKKDVEQTLKGTTKFTW